MPKASKQDTFVLVPGVHIQVNSKSGNTYYITTPDYGKTWQCTCKGFGYYQHCRHITGAQTACETNVFTVVEPPPPLTNQELNEIRERNLSIISGKAPAINPQGAFSSN